MQERCQSQVRKILYVCRKILGEKSVLRARVWSGSQAQVRRVLAGVKILTLVNLFCLSALGKRNL